jgi:hypothetical protein
MGKPQGEAARGRASSESGRDMRGHTAHHIVRGPFSGVLKAGCRVGQPRLETPYVANFHWYQLWSLLQCVKSGDADDFMGHRHMPMNVYV